MNFDECAKIFIELRDKIKNKEYSQHENYQTVELEFNKVFIETIKKSIIEKRFFSSSPLEIFIVDFNENLEFFEKEEIDFDEIAYIKKTYLHFISVISNRRHSKQGVYDYIPYLNDENYKLFCSIIRKRTNYLEKLLYKKGIEVIVTYPNGDTSLIVRDFKTHINIMVENDNLKPINTITKPKTNKSLLFDGKELNLSERFKIANKVLGIDTKIRTLNIPDLEKYQLLAYILGCDKDNARNLMNGSYKAKDRDLSTYFNDLGLNK